MSTYYSRYRDSSLTISISRSTAYFETTNTSPTATSSCCGYTEVINTNSENVEYVGKPGIPKPIKVKSKLPNTKNRLANKPTKNVQARRR